jgi:transcriptional regulator with XRE-family HTH domain
VTVEELQRRAVARTLARTGYGQMLRVAVCLSRRDLAVAIGVDAVTIWRWERNLRVPTGLGSVRWVAALEKMTLLSGWVPGAEGSAGRQSKDLAELAADS